MIWGFHQTFNFGRFVTTIPIKTSTHTNTFFSHPSCENTRVLNCMRKPTRIPWGSGVALKHGKQICQSNKHLCTGKLLWRYSFLSVYYCSYRYIIVQADDNCKTPNGGVAIQWLPPPSHTDIKARHGRGWGPWHALFWLI